jgi:hypothetical protein
LLFNVLPVLRKRNLERAMRFELTTPTLAISILGVDSVS